MAEMNYDEVTGREIGLKRRNKARCCMSARISRIFSRLSTPAYGIPLRILDSVERRPGAGIAVLLVPLPATLCPAVQPERQRCPFCRNDDDVYEWS
jgi:hypothetical protein